MNELIYKFDEHGLYYSDKSQLIWVKKVLFVINAVEINCSASDGEVLSINGFLPLVRARMERIDIPNYSDKQYRIKFPIDPEEYVQGIGYDYFNYFPESEKYFVTDVTMNGMVYEKVLTKLSYDEENKVILLGTMNGNEKAVRINKNYIFGFDDENNLKYIYIQVDKIIK